MCEAVDVPFGDTYLEQAVIFLRALSINHDREITYNGLWKEYGLPDVAMHAKSKAARMNNHSHNLAGPFVADDPEEGFKEADHEQQIKDKAVDDALDLVNYGAFCARLSY